jgi:hypothetical protein
MSNNQRFDMLNGEWIIDPSLSGSNTQHQITLAVYPHMFQDDLAPSESQIFSGSITHQSTCSALVDLGVEDYVAQGRNRTGFTRRSKRESILGLIDMIGFFTQAYAIGQCQQNPNQQKETRKIVNWYTHPTQNQIPQWFIDVCHGRQGNYPMFGALAADSDWTGNYICVNHFSQTANTPRAIEVLISGRDSKYLNEWIRLFKQ